MKGKVAQSLKWECNMPVPCAEGASKLRVVELTTVRTLNTAFGNHPFFCLCCSV